MQMFISSTISIYETYIMFRLLRIFKSKIIPKYKNTTRAYYIILFKTI